MLRIFFTIVLPLILPTALYLSWQRIASWSQQPGEGVHWAALPWVWLAGSGVLLVIFALFVAAVHFGTATPGTYVPPRWENGRIVPGHIEPAHSP
jgi:hypothetical protein